MASSGPIQRSRSMSSSTLSSGLPVSRAIVAGDALARLDDFLGVDRDVGRLAARAAARLVDQEARVGRAEAPLPRHRQVQVRGGAADPAGADHVHRRGDEADHVVDRVARLEVAAGRADDHVDRRVRVGVQRDQAARDVGGGLVAISPNSSTVRDLKAFSSRKALRGFERRRRLRGGGFHLNSRLLGGNGWAGRTAQGWLRASAIRRIVAW